MGVMTMFLFGCRKHKAENDRHESGHAGTATEAPKQGGNGAGTAVSGLPEGEYGVDYHGQKPLFGGARDSYPAGTEVRLVYDLIATDTDYEFYVDGAEGKVSWDERKGYIITFTMPEHDVEVYCKSHNSMVNSHDPETMSVCVPYLVRLEDYEAPEGAVSVAVDGMEPGGLKLIFSNRTDSETEVSDRYSLEMLSYGEYVPMIPVDGKAEKDANHYRILPGEDAEVWIDISLYGTLWKGDYVLITESGIRTSFTIDEEWTE